MTRILPTWVGTYRETFTSDVKAGLVVSLVALPLCLGIALASGAPLMAGLLAGIIGGLVVSIFSGSQVSVSGPAAGLTVVVLGALSALNGDFQVFQTAVVIAGLTQVAMGFLKLGQIAQYIPSSVIQGMLCAIGISIISQQIPYALGVAETGVVAMSEIEASKPNIATAIMRKLWSIKLGVIAISAISFAVLIGWSKVPVKFLRTIPGPVVVVLLGILLQLGFLRFVPGLALDSSQLVALPIAQGPADFVRSLTTPAFWAFGHQEVWVIGITIAVVASLETLLCIEATDQLDPLRRHSNGHRELCAQGIGNTLSGLVGGLPITSVIVRTTVNIHSGGRTRMSAFVHGVFLLLAVLAIPHVLNHIPLAALAVILIVTGYKLVNPQRIKQIVGVGWAQSIPFAATVVAILATDLLEGIVIGIAVGIAVLLWEHYQLSHSFEVEQGLPVGHGKIVLAEHVSFLNKARLAQALETFPTDSTVEIDGSRTRAIDHDVLAIINRFCEVTAPRRRVRVILTNLPETTAVAEAH